MNQESQVASTSTAPYIIHGVQNRTNAQCIKDALRAHLYGTDVWYKGMGWQLHEVERLPEDPQDGSDETESIYIARISCGVFRNEWVNVKEIVPYIKPFTYLPHDIDFWMTAFYDSVDFNNIKARWLAAYYEKLTVTDTGVFLNAEGLCEQIFYIKDGKVDSLGATLFNKVSYLETLYENEYNAGYNSWVFMDMVFPDTKIEL